MIHNRIYHIEVTVQVWKYLFEHFKVWKSVKRNHSLETCSKECYCFDTGI